jgi:SSS family solute:Na+ symporter
MKLPLFVSVLSAPAGLQTLDYIIIALYLVTVVALGKLGSKHTGNQEGFFLADRKLGKLYQFLLNFGNSTDSNGAVSSASLVYQQGVSGVWLGFQMIFLNPYYWFMNLWFRRVRLVTTADLFTERLGSRGLGGFYALFQSVSAMVVVIGFGNLVTYKICSALVVKPAAEWSATERASVEGYRELRQLEQASKANTLTEQQRATLELRREQDARRELRSHITGLPRLPFYIIYTLVVGAYIVMGGLTATAWNEVLQSILTIAFSVILIPLGVAAIGGWNELAARVPADMFELVGESAGGQQVTALMLVAMFVVAIIQINGIIGNMGISGSAKDEFAARFGAVSGTYGKRVLMIMWAFCGLIAVALYQGANALSDPDAAWGLMSVQLLGPGLLGLMLVGLLANNMDTVAAQTLSISALVVRNVYQPLRGAVTERGAVLAGRLVIVCVLSTGVIAAMSMDSVFAMLVLVQTVNVPFGAAVVLMFFWRRLTAAAAWIGLVLAILINIVLPIVLGQIDAVRGHPELAVRSNTSGRPAPVFFEQVVRSDPADTTSRLEGRGRFHLELYLLDLIGADVSEWTTSSRFAARFFFNAFSPFLLLIGLSLITRPPERSRLDWFFGKMKTPVAPSRAADEAELELTRQNPARFDHLKLFPNSAWEFTRWNRVDAIGFLVCCAASAAIIGLFWALLRWASP